MKYVDSKSSGRVKAEFEEFRKYNLRCGSCLPVVLVFCDVVFMLKLQRAMPSNKVKIKVYREMQKLNLQAGQVFLSLGSNLGEREQNLQQAVNHIASLSGVDIRSCSSVYYTEPQDMQGVPFFANMVLEITCKAYLSPEKLLESLLVIEEQMGRVREKTIRYASRVIDIDILLFGNVLTQSEILTLPHPRMDKRAFVLVPLLEIAPNLVLPKGAVAECLKKLDYHLQDKTILQGSR